jgi:hypothetical protein
MELFWLFVAIVVADVLSTIAGIRLGLEDVWFGRRVLPLFAYGAVQIAGFYMALQLLPLVPYMIYAIYGVLAFRGAVVIWNIYLILRELQRPGATEKTTFFSFPLFNGRGFWQRIRNPKQP